MRLDFRIPVEKSREVTLRDLPRLIAESWRIKFAMMKPFPGRWPSASSISHSQVCGVDPLRFFVVGNSWHVFDGSPMRLKRFFGFPWARTIWNPVIVGHGNEVMRTKEACMSFPGGKPLPTKRWAKVELEFSTFFGRRRKTLYLYRAQLVQHEIDHMDGFNYEQAWKHERPQFPSYERA